MWTAPRCGNPGHVAALTPTREEILERFGIVVIVSLGWLVVACQPQASHRAEARPDPPPTAQVEELKPPAPKPPEPEPPDPCRGQGPDRDGDGLDDACDDDIDGDGVANASDNCPGEPNADQTDVNTNGVGDVCDQELDWDLDGLADRKDNCPKVPNPDQSNRDRDKLGDACDDDLDGDRVHNDDDNCALWRNRDQEDRNANLIGDACEDKPCVGNDCGGCGELPVIPDNPCELCERGMWLCQSRETVRCDCP